VNFALPLINEKNPHPRCQRFHRPSPIQADHRRPRLESTAWTCRPDRIEDLLDERRFHFFEGDITINKEWIEYHIRKCDTGAAAGRHRHACDLREGAVRVFELDSEANLPIVRSCVKPGNGSSSLDLRGLRHVPRQGLDPEASELVLGPINKPRWIYSCAKQLMDRVIHAYGMQQGLDYTLFAVQLDRARAWTRSTPPKEGSSRVITQFLAHRPRENIKLVDGGRQKRAFTYIR